MLLADGTQRTHARRGLLARWLPRSPACEIDDNPSTRASSLLQRLLRARGLVSGSGRSQDSIDAFLDPSLKRLHDPCLMPGLERAAERLLRAARDGDRIVIYGDYDVDGVSATAILYHTLRHIVSGCDVVSYVPHRLDEGYGLAEASIAEIAAGGARVIVSVDCGITACGPARVAREAGVDLIITDHHNLPEQGQALPEAYALVHPRLEGSPYPFGELCGAGVAFKLAWRLLTMAQGASRLDDRGRALLLEMMALCSLGVIADVVPLVDENRVLARHGLRRLRTSSNEGLRALIEASRLRTVDEEDVGFQLGPRLNACGRMGHAREAVELLTTATGERAHELARHLTAQNEARRRLERRIFEEACELAEANDMTGPRARAIVLAKQGWHAGVVGIVCSRLVERFHRPAILLCDDGEVCVGSGRSVEGISLHAGLVANAELLTTFGGHDMAAGLRMRSERVPALIESFTSWVNQHLEEGDLIGRQFYDCEAWLDDLTLANLRSLDGLRPFGRENPQPTLLLRGLVATARPELMGTGGRHLSLLLGSPDSKRVMRCVWWSKGELAERVRQGQRIDALARPKISVFRGPPSVELELLDLAPSA